MKKIEAIIREEKLDAVREALGACGACYAHKGDTWFVVRKERLAGLRPRLEHLVKTRNVVALDHAHALARPVTLE